MAHIQPKLYSISHSVQSSTTSIVRKPRLKCICPRPQSNSNILTTAYVPPAIFLSNALIKLLRAIRNGTAVTFSVFTFTVLPTHARPASISSSRFQNTLTTTFNTNERISRTSSIRSTLACAPVVVFDKDYASNPDPIWNLTISPKRYPLGLRTRSPSMLASEVRILTRLVVALVVGGVIGMERRAANSLAGVRTFSLVSMGAAIFMSTALVAFPDADPARVAAAISSSVGFLGAGAMHKNAKHNRGLTTASSIWMAAALGIAAAAGMFLLSFTGAISTVLIARYARFDSSLHLTRGDPMGPFDDDDEDEDDDDDDDDDEPDEENDSKTSMRSVTNMETSTKRLDPVEKFTDMGFRSSPAENNQLPNDGNRISRQFEQPDSQERSMRGEMDASERFKLESERERDTSAANRTDDDSRRNDTEDDGLGGVNGKFNGISR